MTKSEIEELRDRLAEIQTQNADLQQTLLLCQAERDLLTQMLAEVDTIHNRVSEITDGAPRLHAAGEFEPAGNVRQIAEHSGAPSPLEAVPVGIVVLGENGTIKAANRRFQKMIGYARLELAGKNVSVLFEPTAYHDKVRNTLVTSSFTTIECKMVRKNGEEFHVAMTLNEQREDQRLLCVLDLSECVRLDF